MKRSILVLLIVVVLAGWLGTLISRDPGYVLVSYSGSSLQTSLWVALGLLGVTIGLVYYGLRVFRIMTGSGGQLRNWRDGRNKSRAYESTVKGFRFFLEGDFKRAEKFLLSGSQNNDLPAINYLLAARAANNLGNDERRESYLRQAIDADSAINQAAELASAKMSAARGEWAKCLDSLSRLKPNESTVLLKKEALLGLGDWKGLHELLPTLKKYLDKEAFHTFEKEVALARFSEEGLSDQSLKANYKSLSGEMKKESEVVGAYCRIMKNEADTEAVLRQAIKGNWQPELLERYGNLGLETLEKRLKQAQSWHKSHGDDAALQLCLGILYEASGDRAKARDAFERSISLQSSRQANVHLAGLLSFDGDYAGSNDHLKSALQHED
jgi:HemY protein